MTTPSVLYPTLSRTLWQSSSVWRHMLLALVGVMLLTVSAKTSIPFYPVPLTMQTFVVLCLGMVYGPVLAVSTVLAYLAVGAFGFPVFSNPGAGIAYLTGPTGGYLLGFIIAAAATGWFAEKGWDRSAPTTFMAMLIGNALIYIPGLLWLGSVVGWDKPVLAWGFTPFVLGDLLKIVLAMVVMPAAWKAIKR